MRDDTGAREGRGWNGALPTRESVHAMTLSAPIMTRARGGPSASRGWTAVASLVVAAGCRSQRDVPRAVGVPTDASAPFASLPATESIEAAAPMTFAEDPGSPLRTACTALATALCRRQETCGRLSFLLEDRDEPWCIRRWRSTCLREAHAKGSGLSTVRATACAAALSSRPCGLWSSLEIMGVAQCIWTGDLPYGATCTWGAQCSSGICTKEYNSSRLACALNAATNPEEGQRSWSEGTHRADCPAGMLYARGSCLPISFPGQACRTGAAPYDPCYLSYCRDSADGANRTCVREKGCSDVEMDAPKCGDWQTCDQDAGLCVNAKLAADGAACDGEKTRCHGGSTCKNGKCVALSTDGEACGDGCMPPLVCKERRCVETDEER
jgi:hypothetical protein